MQCPPSMILAFILAEMSLPALGQNLLLNPGFEAPPILGQGQSDVEPDRSKYITIEGDACEVCDCDQEECDFNYFGAVSGVESWTIALDGGALGIHTDAGPSREFSLNGERSLFINRWDRWAHQTAGVVEANTRYDAEVSVYAFNGSEDPKGGVLRLIAGSIDADNELTPGSVVLAERTFGTDNWDQFTPDVILEDDGWAAVGLSYLAPPSGPEIGMPLVFAFRTALFSVGPLHYDDASLAVGCAPDLDGNGALDLFDFLAFSNLFNAGDPAADCDANGAFDLFDFLCFVNSFNAGC